MFNTAILFAALVSPAALADGACCNPDEAFCIYTAEDVCVGDGGTYYGDGVDCAVEFVECALEDSSMSSTTHPEPEPEGACCLDADGDGINECVDAVTNDWCSHSYGTWYAGSDCVAVGAECEGDPEPDLGACCKEDTCIDSMPEDECKDVGTWYPGASCDDLTAECDLDDDTGIFEEPDLGACCLDADDDGINECVDAVTNDWCSHNFGTWYAGSDCVAVGAECEGYIEPDLGACCLDADGDGINECVDAVTNDWCSHNFGTWYAGSDCVAVGAECEGYIEPDLGACCRDETCIDNVPEDECKDVGTWYPGASCDDLTAECDLDDDTGIFEDPDLGACCLDEECIVTTADECWADEGAFYGPGSSCDDTFVECCGDDDTGTTAPVGTGTSEPVDAAPSLSCSTVGGTRSGLHLMLPFALVGMAVGFRRREMR